MPASLRCPSLNSEQLKERPASSSYRNCRLHCTRQKHKNACRVSVFTAPGPGAGSEVTNAGSHYSTSLVAPGPGAGTACMHLPSVDSAHPLTHHYHPYYYARWCLDPSADGQRQRAGCRSVYVYLLRFSMRTSRMLQVGCALGFHSRAVQFFSSIDRAAGGCRARACRMLAGHKDARRKGNQRRTVRWGCAA